MSPKALIFAGVSAFAIATGMPLAAQDSGGRTTTTSTTGAGNTTQTDQSEDDWRRSKRKESAGDYDPISNPMGTGIGNIMITTDPIDQLPPESRRHLKHQRAMAIATSGPGGQAQNAAYEPSAGAQADPNLAAQEQAVWKEMMQGLGSGSSAGGSGAEGQGTGQGQTGQQAATAPPTQTMRGGSIASASDILKQMRGTSQISGATGTGAASQVGGAGKTPSTQKEQGNQGTQQGASGEQAEQSGQNQNGQAPTGQTQAQDQAQSGQGSGSAQTSSRQTALGSSSAQRGGSTASASDILGQIRAGTQGGGQIKQNPLGTTQDTQASSAANPASAPETTPSTSSIAARGGSAESAADILQNLQTGAPSTQAQQSQSPPPQTDTPPSTTQPIRDYDSNASTATSASDFLRAQQSQDKD